MEMNTRLQVEHTVTEAITGLDLVEEQLKIAANHPLSLSHSAGGHAIECRINAEDPTREFRPTPGLVEHLRLPTGEGIRIDTHLRQGDRISPHYDSMFAKIIAHGATRQQAIDRMIAALSATEVRGVSTTIPLHLAVLRHERFVSGDYDTRFLESALPNLLGSSPSIPSARRSRRARMLTTTGRTSPPWRPTWRRSARRSRRAGARSTPTARAR
jgi:acetyl-CoA carboxylase biotin carboxylase subunit